MGNVPWQVTMFPCMGVSQLTLRLAQPGGQSRAAGLTPGRSLATHTLTSQPRVPRSHSPLQAHPRTAPRPQKLKLRTENSTVWQEGSPQRVTRTAAHTGSRQRA